MLQMPSCILPRRRSAGTGLDSEAAAGRPADDPGEIS